MAQPTVFANGNVFDGVSYRPGEDLVVADGRVAAVGRPDRVREYVAAAGGPGEVVDVAGGLVLPGFQDAHVHPVQAGLERIRCDLSGLHTREEYLRAVREYAAANPDQPWVLGGGWSVSVFGPAGPTAADLDEAVPGRPVFLLNRDHHGAWVSSEALRVAGVHRDTPDPADGRIERDPSGAPTGTLHEGAMALVERMLPPTTADELYRALLSAQAHLHGLGVTAWQDAILGEYAGMADATAAYLRAVDAGALTARVRGALWWRREEGLEQVPGLVERRAAHTRGRFHAGTVKVMQDGIAENYTAAMGAGYLDGCGCRTDNAGISFVEPGLLCDAVGRLSAEGFQVHVHAIGDRAVREALDAFEAAAQADGSARDLRHHLAHLQFVHPDDVPRFAALGVTANMQPLWAALDEQMTQMTLPFVDEQRAGWQYPFAGLAAAGARLAAGSDWPVSSPDPLLGIHVAVNRWAYGETGPGGEEPFLPEQRLTLEQAFAAYTSGAAYVNHLDETGRLEPGLLADLAVLDRDPFAGPAEEVGAARVVATYVDGLLVHAAPTP